MAPQVITPADMAADMSVYVNNLIEVFQAALRREPKGNDMYIVYMPSKPSWFDDAATNQVRQAYLDAGWAHVDLHTMPDFAKKPMLCLILRRHADVTPRVVTPEDMSTMPSDLVGLLTRDVDAKVKQLQKNLDYYYVAIPKPNWYCDALGTALETTYKNAGWSDCKCTRSCESLVVELWRGTVVWHWGETIKQTK